jgi:hypothetical protein
MTLRQRVTESFRRIPDAGGLVEIFDGRQAPPLTDYLLRPIPEDWNAPPPPESVGGMMLLPAFTTGDWHSVYCIDEVTGRIFAIDPEAPWPPRQVFESCREFISYLIRVAGENHSHEVSEQLSGYSESPSPSIKVIPSGGNYGSGYACVPGDAAQIPG